MQPKKRNSITKHMTAPLYSDHNAKKNYDSEEIEVMLPPLSSNELKDIEEESEIMSQFQLFDSSLKDTEFEGIDPSILKLSKPLTATKDLNERFRIKSEDKPYEPSEMVPLEMKSKSNNFYSPTANSIETKEKKLAPNMNSDAEIEVIEKKNKRRNSIFSHPFRYLVKNPKIDVETFKKFLALTYRGLNYCKRYLKAPSDKFLMAKELVLPEPKGCTENNSEKRFKTLLLDLDETLVHACSERDHSQYTIRLRNEQGYETRVKLNIRPFARELIHSVSQYYEIVIFTASSLNYATMVTNLLDPHRKRISAILSRTQCLETKNGFFIKDLRIIRNRDLKNMIIVDNLAHSFGYQVENGVPILGWTQDKNDIELKELNDYLIEAAFVDDLRAFNRNRLRLQKLVEYEEKELFNF